jgi:hypothetical protein
MFGAIGVVTFAVPPFPSFVRSFVALPAFSVAPLVSVVYSCMHVPYFMFCISWLFFFFSFLVVLFGVEWKRV